MENDQWLIFYKLVNGKYQLHQAGKNIIPTDVVDKVLPVEEHVAMQAEKLTFDGEKLKVEVGQKLLSMADYSKAEAQNRQKLMKEMYPAKQNKVVKVEL